MGQRFGEAALPHHSDEVALETLFGEYELLARSGLFDASYYLEKNPEIAALNMDPLLHYVERGCRERLNPSAKFDTGYYLALCDGLGENPDNPLAHYLTFGIARGLAPSGQCAPDVGMLCLDVPRLVDGAAIAPVRGGLAIAGWCVLPNGEPIVDVLLDGVQVANARHGLRRPDVVAVHPQWSSAMLSGFAAHIAHSSLALGRHDVTVSMRAPDGEVTRIDFRIDVQKTSADRGSCALRRKMRQSEVDHQMDTLQRMAWHPQYCIYLPVHPPRESIDAARETLRSLTRQAYRDWCLCLTDTGRTSGGAASRAQYLRELIKGFEEFAQRVRWAGAEWPAASRGKRSSANHVAGACLVARARPGDEFGSDALLEFALATGGSRGTEMFYSDDRRVDPTDGSPGAFFKPAWSPDLLLSTNYVGRAWCASRGLLERAGFSLKDLGSVGDYDLSLRLTESAQQIGHIAKVLFQTGTAAADSVPEERRALRGAVKRRKIQGHVVTSCVTGTYRIKRRRRPGRVSIIIPTRAVDGLIKTCLQTLRAGTAYRDYEIICIENIPEPQSTWKDWLRANSDVVITTDEAFNWSLYNNQAVRQATGEFLLFLNDDTEIIEPEWLDSLVEQAHRPEVGVVGPLLLYPNRTVQEAGVMLDDAGRGIHAFRHLHEGDPGYFGLALMQRNVIGVTGACLLTRRDTFDSLGGFDETHAIINNDLDFCLRALQRKMVNVYTPHARLIHHELASRGDIEEAFNERRFHTQWRQVISAGDPYFNRNLSRDHEPFTIEHEGYEVVHTGHPVFPRAGVRRILVVKLDHIGDCITAIAALRRLKHYFRDAQVVVLAAHATLGIWQAQPMVDETIEFNYFHARSGSGKISVSDAALKSLSEQLQSRRFDLAIDLRKQPDTRHILQLSAADVLVGFDTQGRFPWLDVALEWDEDVPMRTKHGNISDDLVSLVEAVAAHSDADRGPVLEPPNPYVGRGRFARRRLLSKPLICIHPASGSPMRQWPLGKFAQLIDLLLESGTFTVALVGGDDERDLAEVVLQAVQAAADVVNLAGLLTLGELQQLISAAVLFVGNNSGPQHMAAGLGVPTVGIHSGVVDAREWGPLGSRAVAVRRDMSCSPCFIERANDCPRNLECLNGLRVADVYITCRQMMAGASSVPHASGRLLGDHRF